MEEKEVEKEVKIEIEVKGEGWRTLFPFALQNSKNEVSKHDSLVVNDAALEYY